MYKIKTPSEIYNGVTEGVKFNDGVGLTDNEDVKNLLINDFGYELVEEEKNKKSKKKSLAEKVEGE